VSGCLHTIGENHGSFNSSAVDNGVKPGSASFSGGSCRASARTNPSKCPGGQHGAQSCVWLHQVLEAQGAQFSLVAVVARTSSTSRKRRQAAHRGRECNHPAPRVQGLRRAHVWRIENTSTRSTGWISSYGTVLRAGWSAPGFAAFVSSIIEDGADPAKMARCAPA